MRKSVVAIIAVVGSAFAVFAATRPDGLFHPALPPLPQQDEVKLVLQGSALRFKLGLPDFVVSSDDANVRSTTATIADVLWADLDFEREFYLIPRQASAMLPVTTVDALPFSQWTGLGADLVLAATVQIADRAMTIDVRIVWTTGEHEGSQLFGRRYTCGLTTARGARECAHRMADDIHLETRAVKGVAQTRIAFVSDRDHGRVRGSDSVADATEVYVADYDGANASRLTAARSISCCVHWSPNHALAYVSWQAGWQDIYTINLAEPGRSIPRPSGTEAWTKNWSPAWSPDGSRLAFVSSRSGKGNADIWVANADGSGLLNLTNNPADDGTPTWSPDGTQIAFTSSRSGTNFLYVMSAQGSSATVLVREKVDRPSWSSANFIAFTLAPDSGHKNIGIYDLSTGRVSVITDGAFDSEGPTVSPNGRHIAFETTRWGGKQIAVMDRTGGNIRQVTTTGSQNKYPSWEVTATPR